MPASAAQMRANNRFEAKTYDRINVRIRKDGDLTRKDIQRAADAKGESLNQYILNAVKMRMATDN
jgi:uncharacterized protein (DUF1778 family)